nr:hypothetical protein [Tanacetum cinerariifolium]
MQKQNAMQSLWQNAIHPFKRSSLVTFALDDLRRKEEKKDVEDLRNKDSEVPCTEVPSVNQEKDANVNSTNNINTVSPTNNVAGIIDNVVDENIVYGCADGLNMPDLEEIGRFSNAENDDSGADMNNFNTYFQTASTPIETHKTLLKDDKGEDVDEHLYRSMIGSLMYLTSSRPDIMFAVCACARFQDSPFDLVAYTNSDYEGASLDRKSTTGGLLWTITKAKNINGEAQIHANVDGKKVIISEESIRRDLRMNNHTRTYVIPSHTKKVFGNMMRVGKDFSDLTDPYHTPTIIQPSTSQRLRKHKSRKTKRKDTELPQTSMPTKHVVDVAVNEEMDGSLERATTTATSLDAYARVDSSANEESLGKEEASKQGRISNIDANQVIYLVNVHRDEDIFSVNNQDDTSIFDADKDLQGEQVVVEKEVDGKDVSVVEKVNAASIATSVTATTITAVITLTISMDEITLAKVLIEIKTSRSKAKGIVMQEPSETPTPTPTVSSQQPLKVQDKGKGIMVEEPLKMKKKDQILFDAEVARKLQEVIYEQEILVGEGARQEEEANSALIET